MVLYPLWFVAPLQKFFNASGLLLSNKFILNIKENTFYNLNQPFAAL